MKLKQFQEKMHFERLVKLIVRQADTVTFIVGNEGKRMEISRLCLGALSNVFETMLYGGMRESEPNALIRLPDVEPATFELLINFAYGKKIYYNDQNIISVIKAADKYQIQMLSTKCHEEFGKMININTICEPPTSIQQDDWSIFY